MYNIKLHHFNLSKEVVININKKVFILRTTYKISVLCVALRIIYFILDIITRHKTI